MQHVPDPSFLTDIDQTWTLFLDRDGVININKDDGYILHRHEFFFTEGALEAMAILSRIFGRIIIITNQRGVGRGLMTEEALQDVHQYMIARIECCGGRVDALLYCTAVDDSHPDRKPNPGMAFKAREMFPDIDFQRAVMVGDKAADMEWGRSIGARTVWIASAAYAIPPEDARVDARFFSLADFATWLRYRQVPVYPEQSPI